MPLFYLHQRSESEDVEDREGAVFLTLQEAVEEAIVSARHLAAERVRQGRTLDDLRIEVTNFGGRIMAVVPCLETLSEDGSVDPERKAKWFRMDTV